MKDLLRGLIRELEEARSVALVTVIKCAGSTPRSPGARMLLRTDGSTVGTIGGGALEAFALRSARQVLTRGLSTLVDFDLNPEDSNSLGMICGGGGQALIEFIDAAEPRWLQSYKVVAEAVQQGTPIWMISAVPSHPTEGFSAGLCVLAQHGTVLARAGAELRVSEKLIDTAVHSRCFLFAEELGCVVAPVGSNGTALIFGAGHVAQSLVPVLNSVGFRTVVLDDRSEFVTPNRFASADELVLLDTFLNPFAGLSVDENSYVIIVTRGHVLDRSVLKHSLATAAGYIGVIGSRRKLQLTFQALLAEGITNAELERVHAPIGLDIRAESPAEIAISIAAELIKARAEKYERSQQPTNLAERT